MTHIQKNSIKIYGVLNKHFQRTPIIHPEKTQRVVYSRKDSDRKYRLFLGEYDNEMCVIYSNRSSRTSEFIINYLQLPSIFHKGKTNNLIPRLTPFELTVKNMGIKERQNINEFEGVIPCDITKFMWVEIDIKNDYPEYEY
jgi:hypothetical protein